MHAVIYSLKEDLNESSLDARFKILQYSCQCCTGLVCRMPHRKWRETKLQQSREKSGQHLSCCLHSLHFLWGILRMSTVHCDAEG